MLNVSYQNEDELPPLSVVIGNMSNNVVFIVFGHQKDAELLCLVIVTKIRLNCLNFHWSLDVCCKMSPVVFLVIRLILYCFA